VAEPLRWLVALWLGLFFIVCALAHWSLLIGIALGHGKGKRVSLIAPLLGPVFGILCFVTVPISGFSWYWWLAPLIEPTWLMAAWCIVMGSFRRR
jgi:hypothetical protein